MLRISADIQAHWAEHDLALVHRFLSGESYWAAGIPRKTLERALANSICYGGYVDGQLVAFARAISDQATFAYLADVFVLSDHRGRGYGRAIVPALMDDARLHGLRRWHLVTKDMQPLYAGLGFTELPQPERHMQMHYPDVYLRERSD